MSLSFLLKKQKTMLSEAITSDSLKAWWWWLSPHAEGRGRRLSVSSQVQGQLGLHRNLKPISEKKTMDFKSSTYFLALMYH